MFRRLGAEQPEHLHGPGLRAFTFTFKEPFAAKGEVASIDRDRVRLIAEANRDGQADLLAHVQSLKV